MDENKNWDWERENPHGYLRDENPQKESHDRKPHFTNDEIQAIMDAQLMSQDGTLREPTPGDIRIFKELGIYDDDDARTLGR